MSGCLKRNHDTGYSATKNRSLSAPVHQFFQYLEA
jgi:hypothetical protein